MKTTREIIKENKLQLIRYVIAILLWVGLTMFISYQINTAKAFEFDLYLPQDHEIMPQDEGYSHYMQESMERVMFQMTRDAECDYFGIPRGVKCSIRWNNIGSNAFGHY